MCPEEYSTVIEEPSTAAEDLLDEGFDIPWTVILYNDEVHYFDDVVNQVQKATGYTRSRAFWITMIAHWFGQAPVYQGEIDACLRVEAVLREIDLRTDIVR